MSEPRETGPARVRASDAEREEVAARVRTGMEEGRLTLDEGEQRLARVYATTYRDELPALTADLPPADPPRGRAAGPGRPDRTGRPRPVVPLVGLLVLAAVVAGFWAASVSGPVWPAILFGGLAIMLAKRGRRRHWAGGYPLDRAPAGRCQPGERPAGLRRPGDASRD